MGTYALILKVFVAGERDEEDKAPSFADPHSSGDLAHCRQLRRFRFLRVLVAKPPTKNKCRCVFENNR